MNEWRGEIHEEPMPVTARCPEHGIGWAWRFEVYGSANVWVMACCGATISIDVDVTGDDSDQADVAGLFVMPPYSGGYA